MEAFKDTEVTLFNDIELEGHPELELNMATLALLGTVELS